MVGADGENEKASQRSNSPIKQSIWLRFIGTKQLESERKSSRLSTSSKENMSATSINVAKLVVCIKNTGYEVSLERRKIYSILPDPIAKKHKMIRVVDESGEDYLFPESYFLSVAFPPAVRQALLAAA